MSVRTLSFCQDSQVSVRTLKFACQDSQVCVRTAPSGRFRRGRARSKGGLGVYHSLLGGRGRRVAVKEGGGLVGGTCEHCEDRAPSGPRQDSVRTLSGLYQDYVRTLSGLCQDCQDSCGSSTNQVVRAHGRPEGSDENMPGTTTKRTAMTVLMPGITLLYSLSSRHVSD